jgi:hypothetical protein
MALPWLLWGAVGIIAGALIITIIVQHITIRNLKRAMLKKNKDLLKAKITSIRESGDYNVVSLDAYDDEGNKSKYEIKGEDIDYEIDEGMTIRF